MSDIPSGADSEVAKIAIAWEIADESLKYLRDHIKDEIHAVDLYTDLFNRAYHQLMKEPDEG